MKTFQLLTLAAALGCCTQLQAQDITGVAKKETKTNADSIPAAFPGGDAGWIEFLQRNLRPNVPVKKKAPAGIYTVVVSFLVGKDGSVYDVKVEKDPGFGTAEETLRVFDKSPNWIPASLHGKPVVYRQRQSVSFQVVEEESGRKKKKS